MKRNRIEFLAVAALMLCYGAAHAGTFNFKGSANTQSTQLQLPLANGGTVVTAGATGVAAMVSEQDAHPILFVMRCTGMGMLGTDGVQDIEFYCSFMANEKDGFDMHGSEKPDGSKATIVGGSGRWAGATGGGTFKRTQTGETSGRTTFDLKITTP
jgi:hypothetical protein